MEPNSNMTPITVLGKLDNYGCSIFWLLERGLGNAADVVVSKNEKEAVGDAKAATDSRYKDLQKGVRRLCLIGFCELKNTNFYYAP